MSSYFKRYYLDDVKLAQRALLEFHRSLRSGRMIAFTGSATTKGNGYGTWDELVETYARIASTLVDKHEWRGIDELIKPSEFEHADPIARILAYRKHEKHRFDVRVALGLMEEVVLSPDEGRPRALPAMTHDRSDPFEHDAIRQPIDVLSVEAARYFRKPCRLKELKAALAEFEAIRPVASSGEPSLDVVQALLRSLGIRRFATLNYDLEIERQAMLGGHCDDPFATLLELRAKVGGESFDWRLDSGRIRRVLANGQAVESDILNRERIDRMLEFGIGADDVDHHILHLHGRACEPSSMILSYRDYDRLYRSNDLYKLPFEFAQRIMIGGNPVLFVGLGMSENDVNKALEDFVSSSPYQRMAPTFLLWNHNKARADMDEKDWSEVEMLRLDRFHRLGVLTIFDVDIVRPVNDAGADLIDLRTEQFVDGEGDDKIVRQKKAKARSIGEIHNLQWLVERTARYSAAVASRENHVEADRWRTMSTKVRPSGKAPVILWEVVDGLSDKRKAKDLKPAFDKIVKAELLAGEGLCIVGSQGCGQGALAHEIATKANSGFTTDNTLLINGGFSFDTDSMLDGIVRFLDARMDMGHFDEGQRDEDGAEAKSPRPRTSRGKFFEDCQKSTTTPKLLIVVAGMGRFFSIRGDILSAELDELLSMAGQKLIANVTWLFFGSERVSRYMVEKGIRVKRAEDVGLLPLDGKGVLPSDRLDAIRQAFEKEVARQLRTTVAAIDPARSRMLDDAVARYHALSASRLSGDGIEVSRAFYDLYLGHAFNEVINLVAPGGPGVLMGRELLRALAFIGLPTECSVLAHVPRIKALCVGNHESLMARVLAKMVELRLVIMIRGYGDSSRKGRERPRYALPRSLLTEFRYRFSVPLSEAKLSTSFNMSLYVAQPVDGFIPEPDIHDELGELIDHLMGAYRDEAKKVILPRSPSERSALEAVARAISYHERPLSGPDMPGADELADRQVCQADALCRADHADRLRAALALVRGYYTTTDLLTLDVGDRLIREDRDGILLEHAERLDTLIDAFGKTAMARATLRKALDGAEARTYGETEAFYPDELVWLHNERGVVRLVMGDLVEAAASFDRAFDINQRHVERRDRAHNWRRIRLNQLTLDMERGEIALAQRRIGELLAVSTELPEGGEKKTLLREDRLAVAIARGYRGRALHLQGNAGGAVADYDFAIAELASLDEPRAQAYFLRMRADLGDKTREQDLQAALDLANATRQMDIVYRLRIMSALDDLMGRPKQADDGEDRPRAQRILDEAVRYALQTDMHRVRVEAGAALADARLLSGDYEGALRNISDGLMVATRFGMELSKIHLRSVMARIMVKRGHPITASKLAMTTIKIASRRKFQMAIEHAEETLLTIPKVSAITDVIDASARRQL